MAGAGYKLFNTGDVLTAAQVNTYLQEQAVMRFASAAARTTALSGVLAEGMVSYLMDTNAVEVYDGSAWVGVATGDITAVTAGTGISGGGTSGAVTITNSMATEITAAGDIIVGTGSGTFDNLPIGTTGQVLTADTTVSPYKVKWAAASGGSSTFVGVSVYESPANNASLSSGVWTLVTWNSERYDTDGFHSTSSNTGRITIPTGKGGKYLFTGAVYFANTATAGMRQLRLYKNGTDLGIYFMTTGSGSGTFYPNPQINYVVNAAAGDYFEMYAQQNSGSSQQMYFDEGTYFQASYLGA
jgi:hypothetical protein